MTSDDLDLLHRHLNGDLDPAEQAAFFARVQAEEPLRRALVERAADDVRLMELVRTGRGRRASTRLRWTGPAAAAALMLVGLWMILAAARPGAWIVRSAEGVLHRDGRPAGLSPGLELRPGDRVEGRAELARGDARLRLDGALEIDADGPRLSRGLASVHGELRLGTSRGAVDIQGDADVVAAREVRVEVRTGRARARRAEVLAGRYAVLGDAVREARLVDRPRVESAVARGVDFLRTRARDLWTPLEDGRRHGPAPSRSYAELALLAFRRAGIPADDPVVVDLVGRVRTRPVASTYAAALQVLALSEIDAAAHSDRIRDVARRLLDGQARNGQWDYALTPGAPNGDNSASAYAVLGLRACAAADVRIDRAVLERARRWWVSAQNPDGGWGYNDAVSPSAPGEPSQRTGDASYGSVTAGALASLAAIADMAGPDPAAELAVRKGRAWLASRFAVDRNPEKAAGFAQAHWYAACGNAGVLLRVEAFGAREWYPEIADVLLAAQRADGGWALEQGDFMARERNEILDTCLALIFLIR